jgi:hypothetical protein
MRAEFLQLLCRIVRYIVRNSSNKFCPTDGSSKQLSFKDKPTVSAAGVTIRDLRLKSGLLGDCSMCVQSYKDTKRRREEQNCWSAEPNISHKESIIQK